MMEVDVDIEYMRPYITDIHQFTPSEAQKEAMEEYFTFKGGWMAKWYNSGNQGAFLSLAYKAQLANRAFAKSTKPARERLNTQYGLRWPPGWRYKECINRNYDAMVREARLWNSIDSDWEGIYKAAESEFLGLTHPGQARPSKEVERFLNIYLEEEAIKAFEEFATPGEKRPAFVPKPHRKPPPPPPTPIRQKRVSGPASKTRPKTSGAQAPPAPKPPAPKPIAKPKPPQTCAQQADRQQSRVRLPGPMVYTAAPAGSGPSAPPLPPVVGSKAMCLPNAENPDLLHMGFYRASFVDVHGVFTVQCREGVYQFTDFDAQAPIYKSTMEAMAAATPRTSFAPMDSRDTAAHLQLARQEVQRLEALQQAHLLLSEESAEMDGGGQE
jgi:hypothetical protein